MTVHPPQSAFQLQCLQDGCKPVLRCPHGSFCVRKHFGEAEVHFESHCWVQAAQNGFCFLPWVMCHNIWGPSSSVSRECQQNSTSVAGDTDVGRSRAIKGGCGRIKWRSIISGMSSCDACDECVYPCCSACLFFYFSILSIFLGVIPFFWVWAGIPRPTWYVAMVGTDTSGPPPPEQTIAIRHESQQSIRGCRNTDLVRTHHRSMRRNFVFRQYIRVAKPRGYQFAKN